MRMRLWLALLAAALFGATPAARADVWDVGPDNDNDIGTDSEVTHGLDQVHDVAAQQGGTVEDVDYYRLQLPPTTSWEIVLDSMTGDVANAGASPSLDLLQSDGTTVFGQATALSAFGIARHVTVFNVPPSESQWFARVGNPVCGLNCTATDQYRIRAYDTTLYIPRFNSTNGQVTVLILQNNTAADVFYVLRAHNSNGTSLGSIGGTGLAAFAVRAINLSTLEGGILNNTSGGLRILNDAGYGRLTGKTVALEAATGYSFDTPALTRPH
jgi:hypothetical protein